MSQRLIWIHPCCSLKVAAGLKVPDGVVYFWLPKSNLWMECLGLGTRARTTAAMWAPREYVVQWAPWQNNKDTISKDGIILQPSIMQTYSISDKSPKHESVFHIYRPAPPKSVSRETKACAGLQIQIDEDCFICRARSVHAVRGRALRALGELGMRAVSILFWRLHWGYPLVFLGAPHCPWACHWAPQSGKLTHCGPHSLWSPQSLQQNMLQ